MRWSCPHCGINLAVSDDKMGSGWSFSRCYKCGGFALIRRAEINLVKVDRAPAGEHILLPEASEEPDTMMSQEATDNLARIKRESAEKAAIRQAARAVQQQQHIAMADAIQQGRVRTEPKVNATNAAPPPLTSPSMAGAAFPQPMPEATIPSIPNINGKEMAPLRARARVLPVAIGIATASALGSGVYLYEQGQTLWEKARVGNTTYEMPEGFNRSAPAPVRHQNAISDQLHQNAMAPVRGADAIEETPTAVAPAAITAPAIAAPVAPPTEDSSLNKALVVRLRHDKGMLRSGPGTNYPIVGKAMPDKQYRVIDWNERWFRVMIKDDSNRSAFAAWIRTDLVQIVPQQTTRTQ